MPLPLCSDSWFNKSLRLLCSFSFLLDPRDLYQLRKVCDLCCNPERTMELVIMACSLSFPESFAYSSLSKAQRQIVCLSNHEHVCMYIGSESPGPEVSVSTLINSSIYHFQKDTILSSAEPSHIVQSIQLGLLSQGGRQAACATQMTYVNQRLNHCPAILRRKSQQQRC